MKVVVVGGNGQLGRELVRTAPAGLAVVAVDMPAIDIGSATSVHALLGLLAPTVVINAAAYTAVDKAESESELCFRVNHQGVANLATACAQQGARFVQLSTDFVFDGRQGRPYLPDDATNPLSVYGASKRQGEEAALRLTGGQALVVRTAWLYATHGNNFVLTMLRLMAERGAVRVVADQLGSPTWAHDLARALWRAVELPSLAGLQHWTGAGVASWYDFAVAIAEEAHALGLLAKLPVVTPIRTEAYPTAAVRPACAVLEKSATWAALSMTASHWREELRAMLRERKESHG